MVCSRIDLSTATWRRSSYSNSSGGGDCLEVADGHTGIVPVRDSKRPEGPALAIAASAWTPFVESVKPSRPAATSSRTLRAALVRGHRRDVSRTSAVSRSVGTPLRPRHEAESSRLITTRCVPWVADSGVARRVGRPG
ncbi:hypothetical protein GCM10010207_38310 [Streptomyces atratus]|nr:hypothetical protein GCM10010207_38310 [Streptomyces atratus]